MTYTIVAKDKDTGYFGVAVQTFNLAVGSWVPWAEGGVGAVATQALALRSYGTQGLNLMRGGMNATKTLNALHAVDELEDVRQVGMVDRHGNIAVHTGHRCFPEAGSHIGDGYCTLANMMQNNTVWNAMAQAYETTEGDFGERLLAALKAAQAEGGDMRGKQTAAMLIVDKDVNPIPIVHLRVDYDPHPLQKLEQIYYLNRAYMMEYRVTPMVNSGQRSEARALLDQILELAPNETYLYYLRSFHLAAEFDEWETAIASLNDLFEKAPIWREYLEREAQVDNFGQPGLGKRILQAIDSKE